MTAAPSTLELDGLRIRYRLSGDGPSTLVVLQGWGTNLSVYDSIAAALPPGYRFLQFDLPGFGASDEPREPWNVDAYADFFCRFMQALGIAEATLLGHSYGGRVILKLASRDALPFRLDRIVLVDSAGIVNPKSARLRLKIRWYKCLKRLFSIPAVHALFPELVDDWKSRQGSADYRNATPLMRQCLVMAVNEDLRHLLPRVRQETLLVWGENDTATPLSDARLMESLIPNAGLAVVKGAGHYPFLDQPAVFGGILRAFLAPGGAP